jgi:hypothetical protein
MVEVAEAGHLPIQTDRAEEGGLGDEIIADVKDLEAPELLLRNSMSVVSLPKKPPRPANCQFVSTWPNA